MNQNSQSYFFFIPAKLFSYGRMMASDESGNGLLTPSLLVKFDDPRAATTEHRTSPDKQSIFETPDEENKQQIGQKAKKIYIFKEH